MCFILCLFVFKQTTVISFSTNNKKKREKKEQKTENKRIDLKMKWWSEGKFEEEKEKYNGLKCFRLNLRKYLFT